MYTRSDDDILPAARRRGGRRARTLTARPPSPPVPRGRDVAPPLLDAATLLEPFARAAPPPSPAASPPPPSSGRAARQAGRRHGRTAVAVVADLLLTVTAVLGLVTLSLTVVAARTGLRPLVVRSGSMEPAIATGSMVLVQRIEAADIEVGDVVAVERPDHTRVTHRVVDLERHGDTAELTLKGDANEDPDPAPVTVASADRLVRQVPWVGRAAAWLATAPGGFVVGCLLTAVTMAALRRRRPADA